MFSMVCTRLLGVSRMLVMVSVICEGNASLYNYVVGRPIAVSLMLKTAVRRIESQLKYWIWRCE